MTGHDAFVVGTRLFGLWMAYKTIGYGLIFVTNNREGKAQNYSRRSYGSAFVFHAIFTFLLLFKAEQIANFLDSFK